MATEDETDADRFAPGTYGCHEALHMASYFLSSIDDALMQHPAIKQKPEWAALADKAHQAIFDLYQAIGKEHL